jgi:hypothetical protein
MPDFAPIIREAYRDILGREPDPGGMAHYDGLLNAGMSEAALRETLVRSPEFAAGNPDPGLPSRLGLNVHIPSDAVVDRVAGDLGMRWVRLDFDWFRIEPAQGALRWEEPDRVVARAAARDLQALATLAYTLLGVVDPRQPADQRSSGGDPLLDRVRGPGPDAVPGARPSLAVLERAQRARVLDGLDGPVPRRDPRARRRARALRRSRPAGRGAGPGEPARLARLVPGGAEGEGPDRRRQPSQLRAVRTGKPSWPWSGMRRGSRPCGR